MSRLSLLCWTLFVLQPIWCHAGSITMEVTPSNGKTTIGSQASVTCRLQTAINRENLLWFRRQGNISYKIGTGDILTLSSDSVTGQRYRLEQDQSTNNAGIYRLTITDARLEDSATIECRLSSDLSVKADASQSLIVCADTSSTFCGCMVDKGWASPDCFISMVDSGVAGEADGLWKSVVGLIVAFFVVFAYLLLLLLIWKRESLRQCCREEQTEDMKTLNGKSDSEGSDVGQPDPSDSMSDSATCSTSDPSSSGGSDGPGSSQSALRSRSNSRRILSDEPGERGSPKANQHRDRKLETSFTIQPQIHHNEGYAHDLPQSPTSQRRGKPPSQPLSSSDPVSYDDGNFRLKASPLAGQGAFGEVAYRNFNAQSNYGQPAISTVSGSVAGGSMLKLGGDQTQQNLQSYYAPSVVSLHRSQSQLDMDGTEI